jgi:hypothetical protein
MLHTDNILKQQLFAAADEDYWATLYQDNVGFSRRTAKEFVHLLHTKYAKFDETTRRDIHASMNQPWNGTEPLPAVIGRIERGSNALKSGGDTISTTQQCDLLYQLVHQSGALPAACQKWRMQTAAKTWDSCKDHFDRYAIDRIHQGTTQTEGYQSAHMAYQHPGFHPSMFYAGGQQHPQQNPPHDIMAMMQEQYAMMASLQKDHATQFLHSQAELAVTKAQLAALEARGTKPTQHHPQDRRTRRERGRERNTDQPKPHWCWTHGPNMTHSSKECKHIARGHKDEATKENPMGGPHLSTR